MIINPENVDFIFENKNDNTYTVGLVHFGRIDARGLEVDKGKRFVRKEILPKDQGDALVEVLKKHRERLDEIARASGTLKPVSETDVRHYSK